MKKGLFILLATGVTLSFVACKKSHTCGCTGEYDGVDTSYTTYETSTIEDMKRKDAESTCEANSYGPQTLLTETWTYTCELK